MSVPVGTVTPMALTVGMITFDTRDAVALAAWWAQQLGGTVHDESDGWFVIVTDVRGVGQVAFQRVEDPTPGKNRVHLDLGSPDVAAEVERLLEAGASLVARHEEHGFSWTVLADPDGNQFCVAPA